MNPLHSPSTAGPRRARGFTLIELLTVIAIIGILAAILIPTVGAVRSQARVANSTSNLKQIMVAVQMHVADNRGLLPGGWYNTPDTSQTPTHFNWTNQLMPYVAARQGTSNSSSRLTRVFVDPVLESLAGTELAGWRGGYGMNRRMVYANGQTSVAGSDNRWQQRMTRYLNPGRTVFATFCGGDQFDPNITTGIIPPDTTFFTPASGTGGAAPNGTVNPMRRIGADSNGEGGHSALYAFLDGSVRKLTEAEGAAVLKRQ